MYLDKEVFVFISVILTIIVVSGFAANAVSHAACSQRWEKSQIEHQYGFLSGCLIKVDGKWIPADNYREF